MDLVEYYNFKNNYVFLSFGIRKSFLFRLSTFEQTDTIMRERQLFKGFYVNLACSDKEALN